MMKALIGSSGFIGSYLAAQVGFDELYRRGNIELMRGRRFGEVVCAGMPAQKWRANEDPTADMANMQRLMSVLETITAERFILISTIDVYSPDQVGLEFAPRLANHAYGRHRAILEDFVAERFARHHIIRLPGMFGPGLRKNAIYDLLNGNQLEKISSRSRFQWYDLRWLEGDMAQVLREDAREANLFTEPVSMGAIQAMFFPSRQLGCDAVSVSYAHQTGRRASGFLRTAEEVMVALGAYIDEVTV